MSTVSNISTQLKMQCELHELRLALTRLLLSVYASINHSALGAALASSSPSSTEIDSDGDSSISDASSHSGSTSATGAFPQELTMHAILADALQYLQLITYGAVISVGAHTYSQRELVINLERFLRASEDSEGVEDVRKAHSAEVGSLQTALASVLAELATGNTPVEPVARLYHGSYVTSVFAESALSYESAASQQQQQHQHQQQYQHQVSAPHRTPFFKDSNPTSAIRSSIASYFSAPSIRSIDSDEFSNCSIRPDSSASNAKCVHFLPKLRNGSDISPTQSCCSITPSESCTEAQYDLAVENHYTWKAHPYRNTPKPGEVVGEANYDVAAVAAFNAQLRYFQLESRRPSESATSYQTGSEGREMERSSAPEPESEPELEPSRSEGMPDAPAEPKADRIASDQRSARRSPTRLAFGMGTVSETSGEALTEGARIQRAMDKIDKMIDGQITEAEAMDLD